MIEGVVVDILRARFNEENNIGFRLCTHWTRIGYIVQLDFGLCDTLRNDGCAARKQLIIAKSQEFLEQVIDDALYVEFHDHLKEFLISAAVNSVQSVKARPDTPWQLFEAEASQTQIIE